jgi:hypothetical protein
VSANQALALANEARLAARNAGSPVPEFATAETDGTLRLKDY